MIDGEHGESIPRWVMRLIYRLGSLEKGRVYRLTLIVSGDEPVWILENQGKLENWREQGV
jgi:hypothetical protein